MSDSTPETAGPPESAGPEESLFEKAMRRAQAAGAATPSNSSDLEAAGMAAVTGGGIAGAVKEATSPGTFTYRTIRAPAASLQVFVDALQALSDNDTRAQTTKRGADQATVQFQQLLPTGNWVTAQTVTLTHAGETVTVSLSAPGLAALGGAAGEAGGTALSTLGKMLRGNVIGGLTEAARSVGRLTESAENLAFSSNLRSTVRRIGNALDDEWRLADRERAAAAEQALTLSTCQKCGTPYATADAGQCAACGAPRSQGGATPPA